MSVKIIGLNGSPKRNRNTATIIKWVLEGCEEAGAETDLIHLIDMNIKYCKGCHSCLVNGECVIKDDDVSMLRNKLLKADGLVLGSPVYEGEASALFKTFVNRNTLFNLYMGIFDEQKTIGVASSGIAPTGKTAKTIASLFGNRYGIVTAKTASLSKGYVNISEKDYPKVKQKARRLGYRFASRDVHKTGKKLKLRWIQFLRKNFLKKIILNSPQQFSGVIDYWKEKGWL